MSAEAKIMAWWTSLSTAEKQKRKREVESCGLDPDKAPFITEHPLWLAAELRSEGEQDG